jgi:type II secretion system protein E (GspE)
MPSSTPSTARTRTSSPSRIPVEYQLRGIGQIQVNPRISLTFASGLRSILRQDPT